MMKYLYQLLTAQDIIDQSSKVRFSSSQLREHEDSLDFPPPYCFMIQGKNKQLIYTGGTHLGHYEDADKQKMSQDFFRVILERWEIFLKKDFNKRVVVIEGGKIPEKEWQRFLSETEQDLSKRNQIAQEKWGEAGLLTLLAEQNNIDVVSPEPSVELEVKTLTSELDTQKLKLYYFVRQAVQFKRDNFDLSESDFRQTFKDDYKYDDLLRTYEKLLGESFDFSNFNKLNKLTNPMVTIDEATIVNSVARASSDYRDRFIVSRLQDLWDQDFSIFTVFGSKHALSQEPAIMTFNGIIKKNTIKEPNLNT